jgi:hypothetical protein
MGAACREPSLTRWREHAVCLYPYPVGYRRALRPGACGRGALILQVPEEFYGERTYRAVDTKGGVWTPAQTVKVVTKEEAEAASGMSFEGALGAVGGRCQAGPHGGLLAQP